MHSQRQFLNEFIDSNKNNPKLRLAQLQHLIYSRKNKNPKLGPSLTEKSNLMAVKPPFYIPRGWRSHNHKDGCSECEACKYKNTAMKVILRNEQNEQKISLNRKLLREIHTNRQTIRNGDRVLPQLHPKTVGQKKKVRKEKTEHNEGQATLRFRELKQRLIPLLFQDLGIGQIAEEDKEIVQSILHQYLHHIHKNQIVKNYQNPRQQPATMCMLMKFNQKNSKSLQLMFKEFSGQLNHDHLQQFVNKTKQTLSNIEKVISRVKDKNIIKNKMRPRRFSKLKQIRVKKEQQPVKRRYTSLILDEDCPQVELQKIILEMIDMKKKQFEKHIKSVGNEMGKKFEAVNEELNRVNLFHELYQKMNNRVNLIERVIERAGIKDEKQKKKKVKIVQSNLKKALLKFKSNFQEQNSSNQKVNQSASGSSASASEDYFSTNKTKGSARSIRYKKKNSIDGLISQWDEDDSNGNSSLDDMSQKISDMKSVQEKLSNKKMRSSKMFSNLPVEMIESSKRSSLRSIQIEDKQNEFRPRKKSKNSFLDKNIPNQNQWQENDGGIIKKNKKFGGDGDKSLQNQNQGRKMFNQKNNTKLVSKFNQQFKEESAKGKTSLIKIVKDNLKRHRDLIDYVEKYLKSISLQSLIIHEHNGIFMKKKKIRHLKNILKNKYELNQIDDNLLHFLFNYLQLYEENCKILIGHISGDQAVDQQEQNNKNLGLLRPKDYYQRLIFYELDENFEMDQYTQNDYIFNPPPNNHESHYQNRICKQIQKIQKLQKPKVYEGTLIQTDVNSNACFMSNNKEEQVREIIVDSSVMKRSNLEKWREFQFSENSAFLRIQKIMEERRNKKLENTRILWEEISKANEH